MDHTQIKWRSHLTLKKQTTTAQPIGQSGVDTQYTVIATGVAAHVEQYRSYAAIGALQLDLGVDDAPTHFAIIRSLGSYTTTLLDLFDNVVRDSYRRDRVAIREYFRVVKIIPDYDLQYQFIKLELQLIRSELPWSINESLNAADTADAEVITALIGMISEALDLSDTASATEHETFTGSISEAMDASDTVSASVIAPTVKTLFGGSSYGAFGIMKSNANELAAYPGAIVQ